METDRLLLDIRQNDPRHPALQTVPVAVANPARRLVVTSEGPGRATPAGETLYPGPAVAALGFVPDEGALLFDALLDLGSVDLVVCGHDHINDFVLTYRGVTLAYNEPSGYSSYNLWTKKLSDKLLQGYTRYTFRADGGFDLEPCHNAELYPEAQEAIRRLYD